MNIQQSNFFWFSLILLISFTLCVSFSTSYANNVPQLNIITEEWEPYNFKKDGVVQGISVDMLVLMLERIGSTQGRKDIQIYPWARAYMVLQKEPGTLLFTTARTEEREHMFKWVGPISETYINIYALKGGKVTLNSVDDLKKYKIGTVRGDVTEDILIKKTDLNRKDFKQVTKLVQNTKMLMLGRIDLIVCSKETMIATCREADLDIDKFEYVFLLDSTHAYYAFHKDTPDSVIAIFQTAFDELKNEGKLVELFKNYKEK